jgi:hypothetical protein
MPRKEIVMKNNKDSAVGLDIGTSRIVGVKRENQQDYLDAELNAFVALPHSKLTANVFSKEGVPYLVENDQMLIYGNESARFARLFNLETRRPMTKGLLNPAEPNSVAMMRKLIAAVLGEAPEKGTRLCFSVPGTPDDSPDDLLYHEKTVQQILESMGFQVTSVNEGLAVILSELSDTNYTGIGISLGGGMCNVCMAYLSIPVFNFSISKAGDFIDASAASVAAESATRIRSIKEASFHFNGFFSDKAKQALAVYYDEVIETVVSRLKAALLEAHQTKPLDRPLPVVLSGGTSMPGGFVQRFTEVLAGTGVGIEFSEIRAAADPLHATARGALIAALAQV